MNRRTFVMLVPGVLLGFKSSITIGDDKTDQAAVMRFKQYIASFMDSYKTNRRDRVERLGGGYVRAIYQPVGAPTIDVRRGASLISPYIGVCEFRLARYFSAFHGTVAEAQADARFAHVSEVKHSHTYGYQDGVWIPASRHFYFAVLTKWYDCDECNVATGKHFNDPEGCWEPNAMHPLRASCD